MTEVIDVIFLFSLETNAIQHLVSPVSNFKMFFWITKWKIMARQLDSWSLPTVHFSHMRLVTFCDEINKYSVVTTAKTGNMCKTWDLYHLLCSALSTLILSVAQAHKSSLSSSVCDILYKLAGELNYKLANDLPAIISMLMRYKNFETMILKFHCCLQDDVFLMVLKSHCCLQDDVFLVHSPWV